MKKLILILSLLSASSVFAAGHKIFFVEPKDGETVATTFKVKMGLSGMKLCEAGKETKDVKCGHHHLIVDGGAVPKGTVVAKDETHLHFGKMQTETELTLKPGKHTLTLQFADYSHLSLGERLSATINIEVK